MTPAQKKWLKVLNDTGFVEAGGWGNGQRNRPLFSLVEQGHAVFDVGPRGSILMVQGFMPVDDNLPQTSKPISETLDMVCVFLGGKA